MLGRDRYISKSLVTGLYRLLEETTESAGNVLVLVCLCM